MVLSQKKDISLSRAIMIFFILQDLNFVIKSCLSLVDTPYSSIISICVGVIIASIFWKNVRIVIDRSKTALINSYLLFAIVYLFSCLFAVSRGEPITVILKESALWTFCFWIPIGMLAYSVCDKRILYNEVYKLSFVCSAILLFYFFWKLLVGVEISDSKSDYNMYFSYALILPLLLHIDKLLYGFSLKLFFLVCLELISIIVLGSRGTFLCLIAYFIFRFLLEKSSTKQKLRNVFILAIFGIILIVIARNMEFLNSFGLNSRILVYANSGEVTYMSGRDELWVKTLMMISEKPLLGYGLGGEYYSLSQFSYQMGASDDLVITSASPHNGFLEMLVCFGIPAGLLVSLFIIGRIFYIRKIKNVVVKNFAIILFSVYIIPSFTIGDGVFIKPGIAFFIYLIISTKKQYETNRFNLHKGVCSVKQ